MLRSLKELKGYTLLASDGEIGKVKEFLFDDREWVIRYLVADTRKWLPGRRVLIPATLLGRPDSWLDARVPVDLTTDQVKNSPDLAHDLPVSRRREIDLHRHYGQWPYWMPPASPSPAGAASLAAALDTAKADAAHETPGDPHLRSSQEVIDYRIKASDGEIGHLEDFIADTASWFIRYAVVDTRNWLPGRKVLVAIAWIDAISWPQSSVEIGLTRELVEASPEFDPAAPVNRRYEERLYDFHGRPKYWAS